MLNPESEKRSNERLKTLQRRKKKYERLHSSPIKQKQPDNQDSVQLERYKTLIENVPCALYSACPGKFGPTTFISNKWKEWTGYSPEELYLDSEAWPKCIHPEDKERAASAYYEACRDNVPYNLEYRIVHKETGQVRYVKDQGILNRDEKGIVIRVDGIITDISESKRAKETIRESEAQFRNFLDNLGDVAYETDASGNITYTNKTGEKITGMPLKDIIGKPFLPFFTQESHQIAADVYERTLSGESTEFELTFTNGRICHFKNEPLKDKNGKIKGVFGIARDITERKRTEIALRESEERFQLMFEKLPNVAVQGYGPDGTIYYWNKANESIYGYTAEEAIGKDLVELIIPPEMRDYVRKAIAHGASTGEMPVAAELNLMRKDGSLVPVWSSHAVVRHAGKEPELFCIDVDLRELKHTEEELRESEERFKNIFNNALVGLYRTTPDGRILMANPALLRMLGYDRFEELARRNLEEVGFEPQYSRSEFKERIEDEGRVVGLEANWVRRDGKILSIRESAKAIRDEYGNTLYYEGTVEDITERKKAEEQLKRHRDHLEEMVATRTRELKQKNETLQTEIIERRQAVEALCESEQKYSSFVRDFMGIAYRGNIGTWTPLFFHGAVEEITGYRESEFLAGKPRWDEVVHPDDLRWMTVGGNNEKLRSEPNFSYKREYRIFRKDGQIRWVLEMLRNLADESGKPSIVEGCIYDITERKKAEQALRESEERLKILFESAPDAIYLIDSEGKIVDGNRTALELIGFAKEEVIGKSLAETGLLSGEQLSKAQANLKKVTTGKLSGPNEYILTRKDGSQVSIEVRTFPVKIEDKMLTLGIARDITEHKQTEKKLLEHQARLKSLASQLSLTEERERYRLATDLHDQISQSLVISKIKLDQLRKSLPTDEFKGHLDDISHCLGRVIDDTRALTFDLSYPILYELGFEAAVAEWLTDQIQEKHGIKTEFMDDGREKPLDDDIRVLLFRNMRELLINVVKHAKANMVRVSTCKAKNDILVSVEDDGVGFDPAEVMSMTAKKAEFGLFSIRERLEQLGGQIEIDSQAGRGSKITMTAPLKELKATEKV